MRLILVKDDDEEDIVLLDEVEDLAVRSFDPEMSDTDCLSLGSSSTSPDHEATCLLPSTSSQSVADDVDADRMDGKGAFDLCSVFALRNGIIFDSVELHSGLSSVGLLLALVSALSEPMIILECFACLPLLGLSEKLKIEFCSFAIDSDELELALTGISSKSCDFGRFSDFSSNCSR